MNVSSTPSIPEANLAMQFSAQDPQKLGRSCREFEANLWRQVLDRALSPLISSPNSAASSGNGVYSYFLSSTIAERVSGRPNGFSSLLQAQMAHQAPTAPPTSDPICTKAATP